MGGPQSGGAETALPTTIWAVNFPERETSWKQPWTIDVAAATCRQQAIRAIEINYTILEPMEPAGQQAACQMLLVVGVKIHSMHSPFSEPRNLETEDRGQRLAAVDRIVRCMQVCRDCGIGKLVVHPSNKSVGDGRIVRDNLCRSLEALLPAARQSGVILCLENMPIYHPFGWRPQDVAGVIEQFNDPHLRAVFDTGHANMTGIPLEVFDAMRPHIVHTHIHDNNTDRDQHLPPGYGTVPWPALMPRLLSLKLDAPLFIEALPWSKATDFARLQLETTALANACLGPDRFPSLRKPGEGDEWCLRRDPMTGRLMVFDEQGNLL